MASRKRHNFTFIDSSFTLTVLHQWTNLFIDSYCNEIATLSDWTQLNNFISSANRSNLLSMDSHKEFIRILNKIEDKCPFCGTPEVTKYSEDFWLNKGASCHRSMLYMIWTRRAEVHLQLICPKFYNN